MASEAKVGEPCPVCKWKVVLNEPVDREPFKTCSVFCEVSSKREIAEFVEAKPGDQCAYPCPECGNPTYGEWRPDAPKQCVCDDCGPKIRSRTCLDLLKESRDYLNDLPGDPAEELIARIDDALREIKKNR